MAIRRGRSRPSQTTSSTWVTAAAAEAARNPERSRTKIRNVHKLHLCFIVVLAAAVGGAAAGEIVGKVRYAGPAPKPETVKITKDQAVCAKTPQVESSLLVSADKG